MLFSQSLLIGICLAGQSNALNLVLSNDDGWAEINIRTFYNALTAARNSVVLSAPAENESGTGSSDAPATPLVMEGEFDSIPIGSPAEGFNKSMPRFNYVNSFPVTSMRYGIQTLAPKFFKKQPINLAVAGPNVGNNAGTTVLVSGTVGATTEAAKEGLPAIAFSGDTGSQTAWNVEPVPNYSLVYAALATEVVETITKGPGRYMPSGTFVNVNFPASNGTTCSSAKDFKFVFSRIMTATAASGPDVTTSRNKGRLPTENTVLGTPGCYASISVGDATTKMDVSAADQRHVLERVRSILSCLPRSR